MQTLYTAIARCVGGRDGHGESSDGVLKFDLSVPKSMEGAGKPGTTNPEQLFAAAYASAFGSTLRYVANDKKINLNAVDVTAEVSIGQNVSNEYMLEVELKIYIPELKHTDANNLIYAAHLINPYSNAFRNNLNVTLTIVDKPPFQFTKTI